MTITVEAIRDGYYGGFYRRVGDVFDIAKQEDYGTWMLPVEEVKQEVKKEKPVEK